jgi:hypothetical protein
MLPKLYGGQGGENSLDLTAKRPTGMIRPPEVVFRSARSRGGVEMWEPDAAARAPPARGARGGPRPPPRGPPRRWQQVVALAGALARRAPGRTA